MVKILKEDVLTGSNNLADFKKMILRFVSLHCIEDCPICFGVLNKEKALQTPKSDAGFFFVDKRFETSNLNLIKDIINIFSNFALVTSGNHR